MDNILKKVSNPLMSALMMATFDFGVEKFEKCTPLLQLLQSTEKYDLLITESFASDFTLLFAEKFKIPFITYVPNKLMSWLANRVANPMNPSYMPNMLTGLLAPMSFMERVINTLLYIETVTVYHWCNLRADEKVFQRFLEEPAPSVYDMIKNTSIMLTNAHESLVPTIPMVPSVIPVGGMHIRPAAKLPKVRSIYSCGPWTHFSYRHSF